MNCLLLQKGVAYCCKKKYYVDMRVLNLFQHLFISCLKVLVGVETKDKPLARTENSSSVNIWSNVSCFCCTR